MVGVLPMAKKPTKGTDAGDKGREYSTFRLYAEQAELLNELASASRMTIAKAIEKYLDGPIRDILKGIYNDKAKRFG